MGVKRPLGEENIPELSFKQPKQLDDINQTSTFMTHSLPTAVSRIDSPGEVKSNSCELQFNERLESGETPCASMEGKKSERMGDRLESLLEFEQHKQLDDNHETLEASDEEDTGNEDTSFMHNFPGYTDFSIPWRPPQKFEDPYVFLLNSFPRKVVPMGPDYLAEIPNWDPSARVRDFSAPNNVFDNDKEQNQMGTCVIPMPDSNNSNFDESIVGRGRTDCSCPDVGSTRCVKQHIKEVRENLRESIGDETFGELGFYDMGEEVACNWTANEEQLFHEVVFSNPASHGRDFWEILGFVFPNQTKKEIVSYYFNVFMLRRRAVQNRSYLLRVDSDDDDEEHGNAHGKHFRNNLSLHNQDSDDDDLNGTHDEFYLVGEEDEDLTVKSIGDQDLDVGWVDEYGPVPENVGGEEGSDAGDENVNRRDSFEMDGGKGESCGEEAKK